MTVKKASILRITRDEMENAFNKKDSGYDGIFYVAVRTTGIFCRPSCSSKPKRQNIEFFRTVFGAVKAGYRPCKRCHPLEANGKPPGWVLKLMHSIEKKPDLKISENELSKYGASPEQARRWFINHYGMTFAEWQRGRKLAEAFTEISKGSSIDEVLFEKGYESHSGFRDAFARTFGTTPGKQGPGDFIAVQFMETPLGPLVMAGIKSGICFIEFADQRTLKYSYLKLRKSFNLPVLPATNEPLELLSMELKSYFQAGLTRFTAPLVLRGTAFQEWVWQELMNINYGEVISYRDLAVRMGDSRFTRAVSRATAMNHIGIVIPCHRVVGAGGELTGYGGGLWRKRLLLELERSGHFPDGEEV
jgi:AraC family transcriptional regulator, regulatory protein of adaptative response / methylated-DNA-[protein]-cysteine methyltransferase